MSALFYVNKAAADTSSSFLDDDEHVAAVGRWTLSEAASMLEKSWAFIHDFGALERRGILSTILRPANV